MNDKSIRPSFTPSKVCTAPTGALGRMLHFTRPAVAFSMSAQNGASMVAVIGCPGGTQELALSVTCAPAGADATSAASPNPRSDFTIPLMASSRHELSCMRMTFELRSRIASLRTGRNDMGAQRGDALDAALDDVARFQEQFRRVRLAHGDPAGGAGREHVARLDRDVAREMLEEVRQLPDLVARVDPHALLAVHRAGHPQIVGIADLVHGHDLRPQGSEARNVLGGPE